MVVKEVVEQHSVRAHSGCGERGRRGGGGVVRNGGVGGALYRVGEGAGRLNREGNQAAVAAAFSRLHPGEEGSRAGPTW
jgi:hypothetical protein